MADCSSEIDADHHQNKQQSSDDHRKGGDPIYIAEVVRPLVTATGMISDILIPNSFRFRRPRGTD